MYIYVRRFPHFENRKICKLGKTTNIPEREAVYVTSEIERGEFFPVYELFNVSLDEVDKDLKRHFSEQNVKINAGTEFYDISIIDKLDEYFAKIPHRKLTKEEISALTRGERIPPVPRDYQVEIIEATLKHFESHDIGQIILPCGSGKALLAIFISRAAKYKKVLIAVPLKILQLQMCEEIKKVFPNEKPYLVNGPIWGQITSRFTITTYDSVGHFVGHHFDFKVADEAHHVMGGAAIYNKFYDISSGRTLLMTATPKTSSVPIIYEKSLTWAIENSFSADYRVCILPYTHTEIKKLIVELGASNESLFISAYLTIRSMIKFKISHTLFYVNEQESADLARDYMTKIIKHFGWDDEEWYCESLHGSNTNTTELKKQIKKFESAIHGVICCVQLLGEGFDCPIISGVCFAQNMNSYIRIVQCALRACRFRSGKMAYVLLPKPLDESDNIRNILTRLHEVDENVIQKIISVEGAYSAPADREQTPREITVRNIDVLKLIEMQVIEWGRIAAARQYEAMMAINREQKFRTRVECEVYYRHRGFENLDRYFLANGLWKSRHEFIGIDTSKFPKDKKEWLDLCSKYSLLSVLEYEERAGEHDLPLDPEDYFRGNWSNLSSELSLIKKNRRR